MAFVAATARAQEEPGVRVRALADLRAILPSTSVSALDRGFGKTRYGEVDENGSRDGLLRASLLAVVVDARASAAFSAHLHLQGDAEPTGAATHARAGVVEGWLRVAPRLSSSVTLDARAGVFFPPVSLENRGLAWTSPFTITSSALNSWIGEEVRPATLETSVVFEGKTSDLRVTGAVFGNDDPAGAALAWRGWMLQDRLTLTSNHLPLPPIAALAPGGLFPGQSPDSAMFREVDGRPGFYGGVSWRRADRLELRLLGFDSRGTKAGFERGQYAWRTRFAAAGVDAKLGPSVEILAQGLLGRTEMGPRDQVNDRFSTAFALVSFTSGRLRLTARGEIFRVEDEDGYLAEDDNRERGHALTAAALFRVGASHRVALEFLRVVSDRPARVGVGLAPKRAETQAQLSFRVRI